MDASSSRHINSSSFNYDEIPSEFCVGKESITPQGSRSWTPVVDSDFKPSLNLVFNSLSEVWDFYKLYANKGGFEVRKSNQKYLKNNRSIISLKWYVCSRQGLKPDNDADPIVDNTPECCILTDSANNVNEAEYSRSEPTESDKKPKKQRRVRPSQRIGCQAGIRVGLNKDRKYEIVVFSEKHNHPLVHPEYRMHLKSHRKLDFGQKIAIHKLGEAGIGSVTAHRVLTKIYGGHENVGATAVDSKNYRRDVNAYIGGADAQIVINMLKEKKKYLPDFSFKYFTVDGGELGGLFWADETHKRNFFAFGDVVSFDATYRSNKYDMVFIPFTGIDNHKKCVTFGAGLLAKEDVSSYVWLLHQFREAFPREPQIVLTDQDPAMKQAIQSEFHTARHRLCMWHITEKLTVKVGAEICRSGFKKEFSRIVWTDKLEPEQFDILWFRILSKYNLSSNKWLSDMFELRQFWIPAYFRDWNMSGLMRTSSRSESENHMFGQLMSSASTLVEFFTFFEVSMNSQRFQQSKNDHESKYTTPELKTDISFEIDALNSYTRNIFLEVQHEICAAVIHCFCTSIIDVDTEKKYTITDSSVGSVELDETIDREYEPNTFDEFAPTNSEVFYNQLQGDVRCTCKKFERTGLLCRHIFYVFRINKIKKIPSKYVSSRWTKDVVPPKHSHCGVSLDGIHVQRNQVAYNMREIYFTVDKAVNLLIGHNDRLVKYLDDQKKLLEDIHTELGPQTDVSKNQFISEMLGVKQPEKVDIFPPKGIRNKGSGKKHVRIKGPREKPVKKKVRTARLCHYCHIVTDKHDHRNCDVKKAHLAAAAKAAADAEAAAAATADAGDDSVAGRGPDVVDAV